MNGTGDVSGNTHSHMSHGYHYPDYTNYFNLAAEQVGGEIIFATDDWFAAAENMLKSSGAVFKPDLFTEYGKWMDGWETRRKRIPGNDWCIIQLGCAGTIHGFEVSTHHFTGNYAPQCSIRGVELNEKLEPRTGDRMGTAASAEELKKIEKLKSQDWELLAPRTKLGAGYQETYRNFFEVKSRRRYTHIRLDIFPDGGVARLRAFGEVKPNWNLVNESDKIDLVAMTNGGVCVGYSDAHYGHARNVISPGRARQMDEGWETLRNKDRPAELTTELLESYGGEWAVYRLGHTGKIEEVEIDTNHFKGNFPHSFTLEGSYIEGIHYDEVTTNDEINNAKWKKIIPKQKLQAHHQHFFTGEVQNVGKINHVRLTIYPDGGVSRMLLMGHIVRD